MGNKVALALALLATSIGVSACGGTQGSAGLDGATSTSAATRLPASKAGHTDPSKGCDAQGINSTQLGTGACTEGGVQYVVGNYGGVVDLKRLGVTILGVAVAPADEGHGRTVRPQRDAFLRVTLEVQNRDGSRIASPGRTMLGIGPNNYIEHRRRPEGARRSIAAVNGGTMSTGKRCAGTSCST